MKGDVQKAKEYLLSCSEEEMKDLVKQFKQGKVKLANFGEFESNAFNIVLKPKDEFIISSENNKTIVLDITIDENLMKEGMLREILRQIQVLRKEANFKVEQRIKLAIISKSELVCDVVKTYKDKILAETLGVELLEDIKDADIAENVSVQDEQLLIKLKGI